MTHSSIPDNELDRFLQTKSFPRITQHTLVDQDQLKAAILRAQSNGYALVDQSLEVGLRSLAVPVKHRNGKCVCAIAVSRFNEDVSPEESTKMYLPAMLEISDKITEVMASVKADLR